jgi:uncharacterized tellurite resistance protein B-like protein
MILQPNSDEAMLLLMLSAMHMDGKVVYRELDLYNALAEKLNIDDDTLADLVVKSRHEPDRYNRKAREAITDPDTRRTVFSIVSSITLIDGEFHTYEKALLERLRTCWPTP